MVEIRYTRNLFLRGICVIYLFGFLSFYIQIPGLYGDNGILPAKVQLDLTSKLSLSQKFKQNPTVLWLAPFLGINVDYTLDVVALLGVFLSFLGFVSQKFCIAPFFVVLWALYFSLYQIGQTFMWFQWDTLLLEAGFLSIIVAPLFYSNGPNSPSNTVRLWIVRWLLFRFLFSTCVVKFTSGCPLWWNLQALSVHFQSQVLPSPLAWYAHNLPNWFLKFTSVYTIATECFVPFLFFFPNRKVRIGAFVIQIFLQLCIMACGNYNFVNLLVICLSVSLLDDDFFYKKGKKQGFSRVVNYLSMLVCTLVFTVLVLFLISMFRLKVTEQWTIESGIAFTKEQFNGGLARVLPISVYLAFFSLGITISEAAANSMFTKKSIWATIVTLFYTVIVCSIFAISIVPLSTLHSLPNATVPKELKQLHRKVEQLQIINNYGLFRKMTGNDGRPEIVIEGSNSVDGPWKEYEFLYKPGNVNNSLPIVAPYQPRLDWQMWFAALGTYHQNPWLMSFAYRLLNGQPEVLALINNVEIPFKNNPPKYVRGTLYTYHFSSGSQSNSQWWTRKKVGEYFPVFSRDHQPLIEYLTKMKILQGKPSPRITNEYLKFVLDYLRMFSKKVDPSILLWGVFSAGLVVILTRDIGKPVKKKSRKSRNTQE